MERAERVERVRVSCVHTKSAIWSGSRVATVGGAVEEVPRTLLLQLAWVTMSDKHRRTNKKGEYKVSGEI